MKWQHDALARVKSIQLDVRTILGPPEEALPSVTEAIVPRTLVRGTRGYIERVANQINGTFENGWYDACAVMIRRLLETLIIEVYEHYSLAHKVKNQSGDFLFLGDLIDQCLQETAWNLSRDCRTYLPKLKDIGNKSAHSRRFNATKADIAPLASHIRFVVQELVYLAGLK